MKVLVTGGAGFVGRWVVKSLLEDGHRVWVLDDLSNGRRDNLSAFEQNPNYQGLMVANCKDSESVTSLFERRFDICFHLAADVNIQNSIDEPLATVQNHAMGTFSALEAARRTNTKFVFVSSCMVYDSAPPERPIHEMSRVLPKSPYAASKLAAEGLVTSYFYTYGLPVVIVRPFSTYGPFQTPAAEGGVVSIFIKQLLDGGELRIEGDGTQTRDFLYVEDCATFVVLAGYSRDAVGEVLNAGTGNAICINDLTKLLSNDNKTKIVYVPPIHPQCEIYNLVSDSRKAKKLLGWEARVSLEDGLNRTRRWIEGLQGRN